MPLITQQITTVDYREANTQLALSLSVIYVFRDKHVCLTLLLRVGCCYIINQARLIPANFNTLKYIFSDKLS